jgi:Family of unknown function (DUF6461)
MEVATMTDGDHESAIRGSGRLPEGSEWAWIDEDYPIAFTLMFVRAVTPERLIEAFGADPAAAELLTKEATELTLGYPWIRVGRADEWAFAFDNGSADLYQLGRIARELSAGTDLALLDSGPNMDYFSYFADGTEVTSFEPLLAHYRDGSDPDRFVPQMRQAGLPVDRSRDRAGPQRSPRIAVLEMLTLALGIRLPREVAMGPLLTV